MSIESPDYPTRFWLPWPESEVIDLHDGSRPFDARRVIVVHYHVSRADLRLSRVASALEGSAGFVDIAEHASLRHAREIALELGRLLDHRYAAPTSNTVAYAMVRMVMKRYMTW